MRNTYLILLSIIPRTYPGHHAMIEMDKFPL
jgi:hypothetical protein